MGQSAPDPVPNLSQIVFPIVFANDREGSIVPGSFHGCCLRRANKTRESKQDHAALRTGDSKCCRADSLHKP